VVCGSGGGGAGQGHACNRPAGAGKPLQREIGWGGVFEYRIDFGPGYRVYFGQDGQTLVILLTGGTKKRQQRDIDEARAYWQDYKQSKRGRR
jgi:putative addiction module killer protein